LRPVAELTPLAEKLLDVPQALVHTALDLELADGTVIADRLADTDCVFLAGLHRAERAIADRLLTLNKGKLPWPRIDPEKAIPWIEQRTGLTLADSQKAAVAIALASKVLFVTGGPGVGKTTIVNALLRILSVKGVKLLLCAPTGRAANRMNEATSLEAKTIHRLFEVDPKSGGFRRGDAMVRRGSCCCRGAATSFWVANTSLPWAPGTPLGLVVLDIAQMRRAPGLLPAHHHRTRQHQQRAGAGVRRSHRVRAAAYRPQSVP
jgi:ATP-dependent exoDNAse (exonuclease V) alpha subunit